MKIEILSPVHTGSGEKKTKMNFIIKDNKAYFIDEDKCRSLINEHNLTDKFIQWATQGGNDISEFLKDLNIEKKLLDNSLYVLPIKGFIDREVNLHIKDTDNRFYIPGSSIKGAIRTALLYTVLEETKPDINQLLKGIKDTDIKGVLRVDRDKGKWAGMEIEKIIFRAGVRKEDGTIAYGDAKYDLLRFIHISDAYPINAEYSIMPIRTFSSVSKTLMIVKSHITNAEVIESGELSCNLELDLKSLFLLKDADEKEEWIGLKDKFCKVFDFGLNELHRNNLKEYEEKIIKRLIYACNKFAKKKRDKDFELLKDKKSKVCKACGTSIDRRNKCPKCRRAPRNNEISTLSVSILENNYPKDFKDNRGIIELGFGGGWKGKTAGMYFNQDSVNKFRERFDGRWKGKIVNGTPFWLFPKTMRVAFWLEDDRPYMFPLGWISLEP